MIVNLVENAAYAVGAAGAIRLRGEINDGYIALASKTLGRAYGRGRLNEATTGGWTDSQSVGWPFVQQHRACDAVLSSANPSTTIETLMNSNVAAEVRDIVTRSVSGHSTEAMQRHYSTVSSQEQREGLAKVIVLARFS